MALYDEFEKQPNRLINAQSAYLIDAAYQPVGWFEYSDEAFEEAKRQDKPILLDIGAAWCHWCHVIDEESYENPGIATIINEFFIPIKVDRDERPDIDTRYQLAVQLLYGQGGWPLTVFLTPDGKPFYGATYIPPDDQEQMVGMRSLLPRIADAYHHHRKQIEEAGESIVKRMGDLLKREVREGEVSEELYRHLVQNVRARFNNVEGGFEQSGPKFSHPGAIELALLQWDLTGDEQWREIAALTLTRMGHGGINDQLGGGFHRYSTDGVWIVPHFEKMSFDNALLLENYVHAYRATGNEFFHEVAEGLLCFILGELADYARGGFYSSQDADHGHHDDGSYWTWEYTDFRRILSETEAQVMVQYFDVRPEGDIPETGRNVLYQASSPNEIAQALGMPLEVVTAIIKRSKLQLLEARNRRPKPKIVEDKYAGWNALMISACLEAGVLLGRDDATEFALRSMDVLLADSYEPDHGIYHAFHTAEGAMVPGLFEDQAYTAKALLDAYGVSGKAEYLQTARHLLDLCIAQYWDDAAGGFFDMAKERLDVGIIEMLREPRKTIADLPMPSANAITVLTLDRLWALTHDTRWHEYSGKTLQAFAGNVTEYGPFAAYYGLALFYHLHSPVTVVIVGNPDEEPTRRLRDAALETYRPGRIVAMASDEIASFPPVEKDSAVAYVCADRTCAPPASDVPGLLEHLRTFGKPSITEG